MSPKKTPKGQVFECDQANGECLNYKGYPNSVWPKRDTPQSAPPQAQAPRQQAGTMSKDDYWRNKDQRDIDAIPRMTRSHSQEMAIRTVALLMTNGLISTAEEMKELTDYYQRDVGRTASATTATQPEPEGEGVS